MKSFKCQTAERKQLLVEKLINAAFGFQRMVKLIKEKKRNKPACEFHLEISNLIV